MLVPIPGTLTQRRNALSQRLSLVGKVTWFVWLLVSSGTYPRAHADMVSVWLTTCAAFVGLVAMVASFILDFGSHHAAMIEVGEREITLRRASGEPRRVEAKDVASAYALGPEIEVVLRDGDTFRIRVDERATEPILRALGFGSERATVTIDSATSSRAWHLLVALFSMIAAAIVSVLVTIAAWDRSIANLGNVILLVLLATFYAMAKRRLRAPAVTIGADGVLIEGAHRRFVALERIRGVEHDGPLAPVKLALDDETIVSLGGPADAMKRTALATHIRAMVSKRPPDAPLDVARNGAPLAAWRERLRANVGGADGYRVAARAHMDTALSERIAGPRVPIEERVGAALALRIADPVEGASRVRVAAHACADPLVQRALEAVASEEIDEAVVERAIERARRSR